MRFAFLLAVCATLVAACGDDGNEGEEAGPGTSTEAIAEELGDDVVAVVEGRDPITREDYARELDIAAAAANLDAVPAENSPRFGRVSDDAMHALLDEAWILGEAEERGITVSKRETREDFRKTKDETFKTEAEYRKFMADSRLTQADVFRRVELQLVSSMIQEEVSGAAGVPSSPAAARSQKAFERFLDEYRDKWRARTTCAQELAIDRCINGPEPVDPPPIPLSPDP